MVGVNAGCVVEFMSMADEFPGKPTWKLHHKFQQVISTCADVKFLELVINSKWYTLLWWGMIILYGEENNKLGVKIDWFSIKSPSGRMSKFLAATSRSYS